MRHRHYALLILIIIFLSGAAACTKAGHQQGLNGNYLFKGTCQATRDTTYTIDTATGATERVYIDSTYEQLIAVSANAVNVTFALHPGTFTEQVTDHLTYFFHAAGPFSFEPNGLPGLTYKFRLAEDSLYFDYLSPGMSPGSFTLKTVKFAGKRVQ